VSAPSWIINQSQELILVVKKFTKRTWNDGYEHCSKQQQQQQQNFKKWQDKHKQGLVLHLSRENSLNKLFTYRMERVRVEGTN
jgi:hypothetical protein